MEWGCPWAQCAFCRKSGCQAKGILRRENKFIATATRRIARTGSAGNCRMARLSVLPFGMGCSGPIRKSGALATANALPGAMSRRRSRYSRPLVRARCDGHWRGRRRRGPCRVDTRVVTRFAYGRAPLFPPSYGRLTMSGLVEPTIASNSCCSAFGTLK